MQVSTSKENNNDIVETILKAIEEVRFGSIEITVHEGRVTQIERREKVRFEHQQKHSPTVKSSGK